MPLGRYLSSLERPIKQLCRFLDLVTHAGPRYESGEAYQNMAKVRFLT